jgi:mono/diheme cytochrome c family protein
MKRLLWLNVLVLFVIFCFLGSVLGEDLKPPKKTKELADLGKRLFEQNCATCHGLKGDGEGAAGIAFTPKPSDFAQPLKNWPNTKGNAEKIFEVISKGKPKTAMIGWSQLSEQEKWGLVYHVTGFSKGK